jgi:hypothetical protein
MSDNTPLKPRPKPEGPNLMMQAELTFFSERPLAKLRRLLRRRAKHSGA